MVQLISRENYPTQPLEIEHIDTLGHIMLVGAAIEGDPNFNPKIEVFSVAKEGDRAQIYQMWAIDKIASNPVVLQAFEDFGLAGEGELAKDKNKWTQLVEHIAGVAAIADHLLLMIKRHGGATLDMHAVETAAMVDNLEKRAAVEAAALLHDLEKPAELAGVGGGLENSRDNPVLRAGRLWAYLRKVGVNDKVIMAAQNTGRSDRFFSDPHEYGDKTQDKALEDRHALASLMGVDVEIVNSMTPDERRANSIALKGLLAAIIGGSDAMAKQFRFQGMTEVAIDAMSEHYLSYKTDPESKIFFHIDWPAYYKKNRQYLISQVPENNRVAFTAELDALTHETIFNETVLPSVLGKIGNKETLRILNTEFGRPK